MTPDPTVGRVLEADLCSGCGLCAGVSGGAIRMVESPRGFSRPLQTDALAPDAAAAVARGCPGDVVHPWAQAATTDPYWGPIAGCYTGHAADEALRHRASSGGAISALLITALEAGSIDGVVQIRADPGDPTRTVAIVSRSAQQIADASGSRYTPSSPLEHIPETGRFAFVGKPCDVAALRGLIAADPALGARFPILLSFFCGGIPSHRGTARILADLGVEKDQLAHFQYRGDGWPGSTTAIRHDGTSAHMSYAESWGVRLSGTVQFRCKICPDAVGGVADIACADAWYGDADGYPSFDETDGRSLIVVRTAAGQTLLDRATAGGALVTAPLPVAEIAKMQPSQARRKRLLFARYAALAVTGQRRPRVRGLRIMAAARRAGPVEQVQNFLGMIRRVATGRK